MATPDSISNLIKTSGNSFHAKVARWFQANGWHTQISPYYMDQTQDKARELDLVVEKLWTIDADYGRPEVPVVVRLFVECKYVASEAAFWFAPKDIPAVTQLVCRPGLFREGNSYTRKHHYLATCQRVAKLFASSNGAKGNENEPFFKALNQALNATVAMRGQALMHPNVPRRTSHLVTLEFPVVVCSSFSKIYEVDFFSESEPALINDNFQLEVQYAYFDRSGNAKNELFLLDFVEFAKLQQFEDAVAEGVRAAAYLRQTS